MRTQLFTRKVTAIAQTFTKHPLAQANQRALFTQQRLVISSCQPDTTVLTNSSFGNSNKSSRCMGGAGLHTFSQRSFFNRKSAAQEDEKKGEDKTEETKDASKETEAAEKQADATEEKTKSTDKEDKSEKEESEWCPDAKKEEKESADIKAWKELFKEQETEIESLNKSIEKMKQDAKAAETDYKLVRIEFTKQVRENEETVKRYRKMINDEKVYAVGKFAKQLLEVRDAIRMAEQNTDLEQILKEGDIEALKAKFKANVEGQQLTAEVMDRVLERFELVQYDPVGQKFDPELHEAVFTMQQSEYDNDHVAVVIQSGWKLADRILRAAKVGIVKK